MPQSSDSLGGAPHWVLPFAASLSEPCVAALAQLDDAQALPHLNRLLSTWQAVGELGGDEYALSMPHERLMARAMGWADADGHIPWAAWHAAQDGVVLPAGQPWALLSPGHWLMGRDHLTVLDPDSASLNDDASRALLDAVRPLFEEDGWALQWGAATRWYASHPSLANYPCASLARAVGRNPDVWLTDQPEARGVRRLQSEVQMLLYQHPINDARSADGLLTVNSFWLSGAGVMPEAPPATAPALIEDLRPHLLADDMASWLAAWRQLDTTLISTLLERTERGEPVQLTVCGERRAVTLAPAAPAGWLARLRQRVMRPRPAAVGAWLREL